MPRKDANWIGFQASDDEKKLLEDYCYLKRLTKTEVLRGFIRDLRAEEGENSHHIIKLQLGKTESQILEDYCSEHKMTPTSVLRGLVQSLSGQNKERITATFFNPNLVPTTGSIDALGYDDEGNVLATFTVPPELAKELSQKMTNVSVGYTVNLQDDQPILIIMRDSSGWMRSMNPNQPTQEDIEWLNLKPNQNPHRPPYNWGDKKWEGNDRPTATHNDPKVQRWLDSLKTESDAASLRSMAQQMLAIAERLEK